MKSRTLGICLVASCGFAVAALVGCCANRHAGHPAETELAAIGGIRWNMFAEQRELLEILRTNGVDVTAGGSKVYDIWVPADQAKIALEILSTNHLVIENKLFLYRSPSGEGKP